MRRRSEDKLLQNSLKPCLLDVSFDVGKFIILIIKSFFDTNWSGYHNLSNN